MQPKAQGEIQLVTRSLPTWRPSTYFHSHWVVYIIYYEAQSSWVREILSIHPHLLSFPWWLLQYAVFQVYTGNWPPFVHDQHKWRICYYSDLYPTGSDAFSSTHIFSTYQEYVSYSSFFRRTMHCKSGWATTATAVDQAHTSRFIQENRCLLMMR